MTLALSEFTYRNNNGTVDWAVKLQQQGVDEMGNPFPDSYAMTPTKAASLGFTLPVVLAAINAEVLAEADAARAALAQLQQSTDDTGDTSPDV